MSNLDVIFGKQASDQAVDPVCKMVVSKSNSRGGTAVHEGVTYYFCAPGCQASFTADPGKYLISGGHADHSHMGHEHEHGGHNHDEHGHGGHH